MYLYYVHLKFDSFCLPYVPFISIRTGLPEQTRSTLFTSHTHIKRYLFVCVEVLRPSQPNGVMSSAVSLPNHTFIGQAQSSK